MSIPSGVAAGGGLVELEVTGGARALVGSHLRDWALPAAVFLGVLVAWQALVSTLHLKQFILPGPLAIGENVVAYFPELWSAATYTLWEIVGGLLIGATLGLLAGAATARWVGAREALMPYAIAANAVPIIAITPIFNNWFGLDTQLSKAFTAAVICFFPVMINTVRGLVTVDPAALELMRSYAASEAQVLRRLRIPNALPFIFTALRVATTLATIGAVVGEYFGAPKNSLGQYIVTYSSYLNLERSWAAIVFACGIGIGLYLLVALLERLVMPWHASFRSAEA